MSKLKKILSLIFLIISIISITLYILSYFFYEKTIKEIIPLNKDEVITIEEHWEMFSKLHLGSRKRKQLLKRINLKKGKQWSINLKGRYDDFNLGFNELSDNIAEVKSYSINNNILALLNYDNSPKKSLKLYTIDIDSGKIIWSKHIDQIHSLYLKILSDEKNIYIFGDKINAFNKETGDLIWENKLEKNIYFKLIEETSNYIILDVLLRIENESPYHSVLINKSNGNIINVKTFNKAAFIYKENFLFSKNWSSINYYNRIKINEDIYQSLFKYDLNNNEEKKLYDFKYEELRKKLNLEYWHDFEAAGIYNNNIIYRVENFIISFKLPGIEKKWKINFPDEYYLYNPHINNHFSKTHTVFYKINNEYAPVILNDHEMKNKFSIMFLNMKKGEIVNKSKLIKHNLYKTFDINRAMFSQDNYIYIPLPLKDIEEKSLLVYNAENNKFISSFQIILKDNDTDRIIYPSLLKLKYKDQDKQYPRDSRETDYIIGLKNIKDNQLFFTLDNKIYVLDLVTKKFIYGENKNLIVKDTMDEIINYYKFSN